MLFGWVVIILGMITGFCMLLTIYLVYCIFGVCRYKRKVKEESIEAAEQSRQHFNIALFLMGRSKSKKRRKGEDNYRIEKKATGHLFRLWAGTFFGVIGTVIFLSLSVVAYQMDLAFTATVASFTVLFSDDDCVCYVKCSGDPEDDNKSTYELLFGSSEYKDFVNLMELSPEEKEEWDALQTDAKSDTENAADTVEDITETLNPTAGVTNAVVDAVSNEVEEPIEENKTEESTEELSESEQLIKDSTTINYSKGRKLNQFISAHLNDEMVKEYRSIVGKNKGFMTSVDGKDRTTMTNGQLREDLINLLKDYKVNGRNPECDICKAANNAVLKMKCTGMKKYVKGWTWDSLWDSQTIFEEENSGNTPQASGTVLGHATGQYAITLDDGLSYYWYHQRSCDCVNNVNDPTYGRYASVQIGSESGGSAASRGCSTYATAMALSNVLGTEITPFVFVQDVLGEQFYKGKDSWWFKHDGTNGIALTTSTPNMNKTRIAERCVEVYGDQGLGAQRIANSQDEIDDILVNKGGVAVFSITTPAWKWYTGSGSHFIVIRKKSSDGLYYCLNSVGSKQVGGTGDDNCIAVMNTGVTWETLTSHIKNGEGVGYWNTKPTSGSSSNGVAYNEEVYQKLLNSDYKGKAMALAMAYTQLEPLYGENFAFGVMGNIFAEGDFGVVEYTFSQKHPYGFSLPSGGTSVTSEADIDYLIAWDSTTDSGSPKKGSCGLGIIQWSWGRRVAVATKYKSIVTDYSDVNQFAAAEISFMADEFAGEYKNVADECSGQSAYDCARYVCLDYEKPSEKKTKQFTRATYAQEIYNLIHGMSSQATNNVGGNQTEESEPSTPSTSTQGQAVVDYALQFVGNPYVYGGTSLTNGTDCSGFIMKVYENFGVSLPHSSSALRSVGTEVSESEMQPGDIICYDGHVSLYMGNGQIVHASNSAPYPKGGIKTDDTYNYREVLTVRRIFN